MFKLFKKKKKKVKQKFNVKHPSDNKFYVAYKVVENNVEYFRFARSRHYDIPVEGAVIQWS